MKYLVLLIGNGDEPDWETLSEAEQQATMQKFEDFGTACTDREGVEILAGEALGGPSSATVMRTRSGEVTLTDGPYAESVEQLGGFYLVEAPDLDVLVDLLRRMPAYDLQISPVIDPF